MPENTHTSNIILTEKVIFMHLSTINEKREHEFEMQQGRVYWEGLGERNGRGK